MAGAQTKKPFIQKGSHLQASGSESRSYYSFSFEKLPTRITMFTSVYSEIYGSFVHCLSLLKDIYNAWDMPFVPQFPLSMMTISMPGPSKWEMFLMKILSFLPPSAIPGNCFHTCIMHVNVGKTNQKKIGMRYHYVSEPSCAHLSISTQRSSRLCHLQLDIL